MSRARVYCDVNETRPREYWDYETLNVAWGCVSALFRLVLCGPLFAPSEILDSRGGNTR